MRVAVIVLALDAALARCSAAVVSDGTVLAEAVLAADRGQAAALPPLLERVLAEAGARPQAVAVCVGPGSFTGLRAAIALAQGYAAGAGLPVVGVTVAEALAADFPGRQLWTAIDSRRGRVFLERDGVAAPTPLAALPAPDGPVAIAGDAAVPVAAALAARGFDVMLTDRRLPLARDVAAAALPALRGERPVRPAEPLYIDPPEAKLPAGGLRPPPA